MSPLKVSLRAVIVLVAVCTLMLVARGSALAQSDAAPAGPAANPVVNVAHFAPFGTNVLSTTVGIRVNGMPLPGTLSYGDILRGITQLPPGTFNIEIVPVGSSSPIITGTVTLAADKQYTLAAIGDGSSQPARLEALEDDLSAPPPGMAKVRIAHFAPFASTLDGTKVDICNDATGTPVPGLTGVPFGIVSPYLPIPAGIYDLSIALAGTNCATVALDIAPIAAVAEKIYDIYAIGKNTAAFPLEVDSITGLDYPASATIGHFAPFAADITGTLVDIRVNGTLAYTNVAYGDFVTGVQLMPGPTLVEILPAGTQTVALSGTLPVAGGTAYDLFAIGGANGQPLGFSTNVISTTVPAGKAVVTIGHLAPFAADLNNTAVDVCTDDGLPLPGLTNVMYPQVAANLVLDPGRYDLKIAVAGTNCATTALDLPRFWLYAGQVADAFVIGTDTAEYPLRVVTTTGLLTVELFLPAVLTE